MFTLKMKSRMLNKEFLFSAPKGGGYIFLKVGDDPNKLLVKENGNPIYCNNEKGFKSQSRSWFGRFISKQRFN